MSTQTELPNQAPLKVSSKELRSYTDEQLAKHIGYFNSGAPDHILGELEFRRRTSVPNEIRGWAALAISVVALVVSIYAAFFRAHT
jgi:hypothetical protein